MTPWVCAHSARPSDSGNPARACLLTEAAKRGVRQRSLGACRNISVRVGRRGWQAPEPNYGGCGVDGDTLRLTTRVDVPHLGSQVLRRLRTPGKPGWRRPAWIGRIRDAHGPDVVAGSNPASPHSSLDDLWPLTPGETALCAFVLALLLVNLLVTYAMVAPTGVGR